LHATGSRYTVSIKCGLGLSALRDSSAFARPVHKGIDGFVL
jgi:hypothetical protein